MKKIDKKTIVILILSLIFALVVGISVGTWLYNSIY